MQQHAGTKGVSETSYEIARGKSGCCGFAQDANWCRGIDAITGGGLPRNRTSLILGGPGAGKTVFALQTLVNGARQFGEPGIFAAFEENSRRILANAASFGWNLPKLEKKQLFFFDAKMG
jgi:KaiC/GvpD/RAD55 family RecA-like ATPase